MIRLRIENDKGLTRLLKKHKKYYFEYRLNIYAQGYECLFLSLFAPTLFAVTMAVKGLEVMRDSLRRAKII